MQVYTIEKLFNGISKKSVNLLLTIDELVNIIITSTRYLMAMKPSYKLQSMICDW